MDPITALAALNATIQIAELLAPQIEAAVNKGEISVTIQAALKARLDALRNHAAFAGPEWQQSSAQP